MPVSPAAGYDSGLEVEYGLNTLQWVRVPLDAGTRRVISDGMRVLYGPRRLLHELAAALDDAKSG